MTSILSRIFILSAFTFLLAHCATIIHGSRQNVVVLSEPKKANITIDRLNYGQTPYLARLKRNTLHKVTVTMDGYLPYEVTLKKKLDGWFFGNILLGGLVGIVVDAATGSMFHLTPKDVDAQLSANATSINTVGDGVYVAVVLKADPQWKKIAQLQTIKATKSR